MYKKENSALDEHRLQQYNDLKPVTKRVLGLTLRAAAKMMKWVITAAFHIPAMVKRLAPRTPVDRSTPPARR